MESPKRQRTDGAGASMFGKDAVRVPDAPTFRPTAAQFADPCAYIASIRATAAQYGAVKIVPPPGFALPSTMEARLASPRLHKTRLQRIHRLQDGLTFPDGRTYTMAGYKRMADAYKQDRCGVGRRGG